MPCNLWNPNFNPLHSFSPLFSVRDGLFCVKAENVERENCTKFVFIMYAYRNHDKIMHKQCDTGGGTINLLNNVKQLGDAIIMFCQSFYIFASFLLEKEDFPPKKNPPALLSAW